MSATHYFDEPLRGSDWGEPTQAKETAVDLFEYEGFVHLEMRSESTGDNRVVLFSLSEARRFQEAITMAILRIERLGER